MPRKLKFYRPKNYERKKLSFIISIRLQDVTVTSLSAVPNQLVQIPQLILFLPICIIQLEWHLAFLNSSKVSIKLNEH